MANVAEAFIEWGRECAIPLNPAAELDDFSDLAPLRDVIGDAQFVGHGESHHYTREFNRFRSRMFRFLVREMGFTTFALEVGFVEAKIAHDFVAGRHDDADEAFINVNQTFGLWAQQQEMLMWMRDYNRDKPDHMKLSFYGMDGSREWTHAGEAVESTCKFLDGVDVAFAAQARRDILPLARKTTTTTVFDTPTEVFCTLIHGLTRLIGRLESEQIHYVERSSQESFDWALSGAVMAQQIGTLLSEIRSSPEQAYRAWNNIRDFNMARQLRWIAEREPSDARILFGLHNYHLQSCFSHENGTTLSTMGQYLRSAIPARDLVLIAGHNNFSLKPDDAASPESNQGTLARLGLPSFVLDLRRASDSAAAKTWLSEVRPERFNTTYNPLALANAYDAIHYTETLSLDELRLPARLRMEAVAEDKSRLDGLVGTYLFHGISNEEEVLDLTRDGDRLFTDVGDRNGELFPLYRSELFAVSPGVYRWKEWPAELTFEYDEDGVARKATVQLLTTCYTRYGKRVDQS